MARSIAVAAFSLLAAREAQAATWGHEVTSSSSVRFWVNDAPWADVHYQVNGGGLLNFRMTASGSNHTYSAAGIPTGATVRYFLTIGNFSGGAFDTSWTEFPMSDGGGGGGGDEGEWAVVWEDTFTGTGQPSTASWTYHVGNGFNPGLGGFDGWGNGEWEWYRPEQCFQEGGNLVLRAVFNSSPTSIHNRDWYQFSCRITTKGKRSWTYGRIEARIAMPSAIGTWPAFWMMGDACSDTSTAAYNPPLTHYDVMSGNWSSCGEVDIMEHRNTEAIAFQNLFWDSRIGLFPWADGQNNQQPHQQGVGNVTAFHLYTIEWEPDEIRWYIDRESNPTPVHTVAITASNREEFHRPFHLILNLALSGAFTGNAQPNPADFPMSVLVDYVRVWQRQP